MIQNTVQFITQNYANNPSQALVASGAICTLVAAESALRFVAGISTMIDPKCPPDLKRHFVNNMWGTVLFGTCATNTVPYFPQIGTAIFAINALFVANKDDQNCLLSTRAVAHIMPAVRHVISKIVWPILRGLGEAIWNVVGSTVMALGRLVGNVMPKTLTGFAAVAAVAVTIGYVVLVKDKVLHEAH